MQALASFTAVCVLLQCNVIEAIFSSDIDFDRQDEWGGLCNTGMRQSPINIDTKKVVHDQRLPDLVLGNFNKGHRVIVTNQGQFAEFNFSGKSLPTLSGGGLKGHYTLQNLYLVFPSAHTVNGTHYPLEGIFVFSSNKYVNIEEAYTRDDGVAYLSVFYELGATDNRTSINQLAEAVSNVSKEVYSQTEIENFVIAVYNLKSQSFFTYKGSITGPPCYESVTLFLLENPVKITKWQLEKLTTLYQSCGRKLTHNNRRVQPLNEREVRYKFH